MAAGTGSGQASGVFGILWAIVWALLLVFLAFEIATFCAFWYIILLPFTVCFQQLSGLTDIFLKGIQLPHFCADNMMHKRTFTEAIRLLTPST